MPALRIAVGTHLAQKESRGKPLDSRRTSGWPRLFCAAEPRFTEDVAAPGDTFGLMDGQTWRGKKSPYVSRHTNFQSRWSNP